MNISFQEQQKQLIAAGSKQSKWADKADELTRKVGWQGGRGLKRQIG
jgi:hypothetical protein